MFSSSSFLCILVLASYKWVDFVAAQPPPGGGMMEFAPCTCTQDVDYKMSRYEEVWPMSANSTGDDNSTGSTWTVRTMGVPNHPFHNDRETPNPNAVCFHPVKVTLPVNPVHSGNFTDTPFGTIGILKTGAFVYNHLANMQGSVANHETTEQPSLDTCFGHANPECEYHYHEISKLAVCSEDQQEWDSCEVIGHLFDGFPLLSHCFSPSKNRYLTSCYKLIDDSVDGSNTDDWVHVSPSSSNSTANGTFACDLDEANGYNFTLEDNIVDQNGDIIIGYAYIATDTYPWVMPFYVGSTWAEAVTITENDENKVWAAAVAEAMKASNSSTTSASLSAHHKTVVTSAVILIGLIHGIFGLFM